MKHTKKFMAILLTMVLVLTIGFSVFAEGETKNDSITVDGAKEGETYRLYKLFDLSVNSETEPTAYSYTVNSDWADFFKAAAGPGAQYITLNKEGYVTEISDAAALAKAAAEWAKKPDAKQTKTVEGEAVEAVEFTGLEDGYWLITSTLGTIAMTETTPDASAVTVNEKNPEDTIEKTVQEENGAFDERNDAQIGDTVNFKSTIKIVKGTRNVVVHDKMDQGLTYTKGSVAIKGLTEGTEYLTEGKEYTVNDEKPKDEDTFDITFTQSWIDELDFGTAGYKEYVITYTATINENAVVKDGNGVAIKDQNNKTHVSFGNNTVSKEDTTTTTTHKFSVFKHAEKNTTDNLAGAVFSLKKAGTVVKLVKLDDNNYRVAMEGDTEAVETFTTVKEGDIVIWGVDTDNDYTLEEITPPAGYNKLEKAVAVTVDAANSSRLDVENKSGNELPSTGGIGTTLFYVIGGIMLIGAGLVLVARKRADIQ